MQRVHKIALVTNNAQHTYLSKCAGTARFAYNWALAQWNRQYEEAREDPTLQRPTQIALRRQLNSVKREQYPWMMEVTKCAAQEAIIDLGRAFDNFFCGRAKHPTFHKKGNRDSFRVSSGFFKVDGKSIRLPKIGWLKMRESLRWPEAKLVSASISYTALGWFVAIVCDIFDTKREAKTDAGQETIGIDLGVREYVDSNAKRYELPRAYRNSEQKLRRAQQSLARKQKGSANRKKQRRKVARIHAKTANIRSDWLHKLSAEIVAHNATIAVEDLNVKGMVKNHHLAKSLADAAFGEFRRQLEYKSDEVGHIVIVANRFYPSSKLCSTCGAKAKRLPLSVRDWVCPVCGSRHDRDVNAALNLKQYAESSPVSACGEFFASDGISLSAPCQVTSMKQELSLKPA